MMSFALGYIYIIYIHNTHRHTHTYYIYIIMYIHITVYMVQIALNEQRMLPSLRAAGGLQRVIHLRPHH